MILIATLTLVIIACGVVLLRRLLPRVRKGFVQLRSAADAVIKMHRHTELLYQMGMECHTPSLPFAADPSTFESGRWETLGGDGIGWAADTFYKVRGMAVHDGALFASLTGPKADGPNGHVWKLAGQTATLVGGDIGDSWRAENSFVDHVFSRNADTLLAAEKTGVWSLTDGHWTLLRDGLTLDEKSGPYCFANWKSYVAMGQWGNPRVALLDSAGKWSYLANPDGGWGAGARTIYCLAEFKGALYAGTGTGKLTGQASAVWRFDGKSWEKIGGDGIRGSWARDGLPFVLSLTVFGERLIATVSRPIDTPKGASSVWLFDGDRWGPLAVGATPALMAESLIMNDAIVFKGQLVVATGHSTRRSAQIWALDGNQSWQPVGPAELESPPAGEGGWWVYRLCTDGERLYASTAGHKGAARVLCFTPGKSPGLGS